MKKPSHSDNESPILYRITDLLIQKGISQRQLTEHLGLKKGAYTAWKANSSDSFIRYIDEIAKYLDVNPTYLLRGSGEQIALEDKTVFDEQTALKELTELFQMSSENEKQQILSYARNLRRKTIILKVKFMSAEHDGWEYLEGPPEKIEVDPSILLTELSKEINDVFGIPEGRNHAFYMDNTRRPPYKNVYSDLPDDPMYKDEDGVKLADVLCGEKFKYEYSFSDGLCFQVTVKGYFVQSDAKR